MVGNEMKTRTDAIQDNIITLGSQSVVTTPFGASVIFACKYELTIEVGSPDFVVASPALHDTFNGTGYLAAGFAMTLNNGNPPLFLLGSKFTWSVTKISTLTFHLDGCTVQHGSTFIPIVKESCFASTLDVVPDANKQGFSYPVFKGVAENDTNQKIKCTLKICEVDQCQTPTACPANDDDAFHGYLA